jgi:hypothetical protein
VFVLRMKMKLRPLILFRRYYKHLDTSKTTPGRLVQEIMIRHSLRPQFGDIITMAPLGTLENHTFATTVKRGLQPCRRGAKMDSKSLFDCGAAQITGTYFGWLLNVH